MLKQSFFLLSVLTAILFSARSFGEEIPHPTLNIPYLCTFGNESGVDWGDDDFSQTIFFSVPEKITKPFYISIFDPDVGGKADEIQKKWNTKTRFELYGGAGAYTDPNARGVKPEGPNKSGELLATKIYGMDRKTDRKWILFAEVDPKRGELVDGRYLFKFVVEGIEGDDGNLYKLALSASPDRSAEVPGIEAYAYEWSYRLPNNEGTMIYSFPFAVPRNTRHVISNLWDFDGDNMVYLNTPTRPGVPVYSTGNNEWGVTEYSFKDEISASSEDRETSEEKHKRWSRTTYDILEEDFSEAWTFQIHKGKFPNNDIVFNVTDLEGNPFPMYSTARPRSSLPVIMAGKVYEPDFITTPDTLFVEQDTVVSADVTLAAGTVLAKGMKIGKGTRIPQEITVQGSGKIPADTLLEEDVILAESFILKDKMALKKDSVLSEDTQIAKGSFLYNGLAPGPEVLPACNTVFLDASETTDPDDNPLTFNWELGDGSKKAHGQRVIHTYRKAGSYVVSLIATDDSGAVNDAASKAITITVNAPPAAEAGDKQWACPGETVRFDGSKSYDPDGFITEYKWSFGDGSSASGVAVSHVYKKPGIYPVRLNVTDKSGSRCSSDADGLVVFVNDPPVADAGPDISGCDYIITFDARKSFDPDGKITKYLWYFGDGSAAEGPTPEYIYIQPGDYKVKLIVSDDSESLCNTASDEIMLSVNAPPVAEVGPDRRVCGGKEIYLEGAASSDPNDDRLTYQWDFGDGSPHDNEKSPFHLYKETGKYVVTLTVTDDSGSECAKHTDTALITIDTKPVANAGPDRVVDPEQTVSFDASGSTDPNGYPLTFNWTFGDLSEPVADSTATHVYDKPGVYRALLTVTNMANAGCNTDSDEVIVTVNHPPVARAGTPFIARAGAKATFDAGASFDPDGSIAEYEWNFGDQTPAVRSPSPKVRHVYAEPGQYSAVLTVRDNTGLPGGTAADVVQVTVNFPPTADAGKAVKGCAGQIIFDGTGSTDPDGNIIAYEWDFGDGKKGRGGRPVHIYKSPGIYNITLTVTDNSGTDANKASDTTTVEINGPPVVDIGGELQTACAGSPTRFDVADSYDPNDDPLTFTWDFGDGETGTGAVAEHIYKRPGRFIVSVTADDARNTTCSRATASKIVAVNELPVADAGQNQYVNPNDKVFFDASGSTDPDGKVTGYMWNFGDKTTGKGLRVRHAYPVPGKYDVTLTVTDNSGLPVCNKASDEVVVTVNAPPVADAGRDLLDICSKTIEFDGTASRDSEGKIVFYEWDFGDGSPVSSGPNPTHTYLKPGTYNVVLRVIDDSELPSGKSRDVVNVVINNPPSASIRARSIVCPGETVRLSGRDSMDSDGHITAYQWDFGDGSPKVRGRDVSHVYDKSGKYIVTLTVADNSRGTCKTGTTTRPILVASPPVAVAGGDIVTCVQTTNCSFTLDAGDSYDDDGDHLMYRWNFGDGKTKNGIRVQHEYFNPGVYTVTLTVTDDSETACNRGADTLKVTANAPPDVELKKGD
ncbi:PKD domain-containing protein [Desulfobacterales bacterium HSG2]|nr:PKD domain-containing protein [Desulfobacterales bacterium HSG2]